MSSSLASLIVNIAMFSLDVAKGVRMWAIEHLFVIRSDFTLKIPYKFSYVFSMYNNQNSAILPHTGDAFLSISKNYHIIKYIFRNSIVLNLIFALLFILIFSGVHALF